MGLFNAIISLSGASDTDVIEGERMSRHTSYRIGGPAGLFITCHSYHSLRRAIEVLDRERVPWVVLGKGSNLLVSDEGYPGAVITLGREFAETVLADDGCTLTVGAATPLPRLVNNALSRSLSGLEFAVGIPGTLGGAVSMNAGTRNEWIGSVVEGVVTYKPGEGMRYYAHEDLRWDYRDCSLPRDEIILEATLSLEPGYKQHISDKMERFSAHRRRTQPVGTLSCGSVFKNPHDRSAAALIEGCGLKGYSVGGAEVSEVHANFIVNTGKATASDVASVINHVYEEVRGEYGIALKPEVKFLGF